MHDGPFDGLEKQGHKTKVRADVVITLPLNNIWFARGSF